MSKKSLYINIKLSEVPGVARGILKTFLRILKGKNGFSLTYVTPRVPMGLKKKFGPAVGPALMSYIT